MPRGPRRGGGLTDGRRARCGRRASTQRPRVRRSPWRTHPSLRLIPPVGRLRCRRFQTAALPNLRPWRSASGGSSGAWPAGDVRVTVLSPVAGRRGAATHHQALVTATAAKATAIRTWRKTTKARRIRIPVRNPTLTGGRLGSNALRCGRGHAGGRGAHAALDDAVGRQVPRGRRRQVRRRRTAWRRRRRHAGNSGLAKLP